VLVVFNSIDTDEGTAGSVGQFGRSNIIAKLSDKTLHLIESFSDGPLHITTVFNHESCPGKLKAVHTRHEHTDVSVLGFTSSPEQYYGECEVVERKRIVSKGCARLELDDLELKTYRAGCGTRHLPADRGTCRGSFGTVG
jgi:hypothetical protein